MSREEMTPRQRWLAAIAMEPVDYLPFWAKVGPAYAAAQDQPFRDMDITDLHEWVGSTPPGGGGGGVRETRTNTAMETERKNGTRECRYVTPRGTLTCVQQYDAGSTSWHPIKFPVETRNDIGTLRLWFEDADFEVDQEALEQSRAQVKETGDSRCSNAGIATTPIMQWLQHFAGIEAGHYMLLDHPEDVEALFEAHHQMNLRRARRFADIDVADTIWLTENTSTTLINPDHYARYCYPLICDYAEAVRETGRPIVIHMCGYLKDLLPQLTNVPAKAFEAFTSPPVGNTRFADGRAGCPDKCLIGGTNAALWTRPADEIIAELGRDLDALPHHRGIIVSSAGVMPPAATPQTIRAVSDFVKNYPVRM